MSSKGAERGSFSKEVEGEGEQLVVVEFIKAHHM
jgi:hypothetical protein